MDMTTVNQGPPVDEGAELLAAWQRGDVCAGRAFYARHASAVKHYFRRRVAATHDVADLVQDTFIRCQNVTYRGEGSMRALIFGIAFRIYHEYLRKVYRVRNVEVHDDDLLELSAADFESDPEYVLNQKQTKRLLMKAMRRIPHKYQMVLELSRWEGLTQAEIAGIMNRPAPTIGRMKGEAIDALERAMHALAKSPELHERTTMTVTSWRAWLHQ